MTPVSLPSAVFPSQTQRGGVEPPSAPAPAALSAPAMSVRVEWAGAVRPPDALLRVFRPEVLPRTADPTMTGPPPAFAANLLDQLPDSMDPDGALRAAQSPGEAEVPSAPIPGDGWDAPGD